MFNGISSMLNTSLYLVFFVPTLIYLPRLSLALANFMMLKEYFKQCRTVALNVRLYTEFFLAGL